jgi:hypothetical protein
MIAKNIIYPTNWKTVKAYQDGSRWCCVEGTNIPVQVFAGGISRREVEQAEQVWKDILTAHAQDTPFFMIADLRRLQGMTGYIRQSTKGLMASLPRDRQHYFALVMVDNLPNRLLGVFTNGLARTTGRHIHLYICYTPEAAMAWIEQKRANAAGQAS